MEAEMIGLDRLFDLVMRKRWKEVEELYKKNPVARIAKLVDSEETALHVAISIYQVTSPSYEYHIHGMIDSIPDEDALNILSMKNNKGNTPLHLAAAVGSVSICESIALPSRYPHLLSLRNELGETPLFVAADRGKLDAFLFLENFFNPRQPPATIWQGEEEISRLFRRTVDGNTILHSAISREHFGLFVDKLKEHRFPWNTVYGTSRNNNCPENYKTCIDIFFLVITPIYYIIQARSRLGDYEEEEDDLFRPNYATFTRFLKILMKLTLTLIGLGLWRIGTVQARKEKHAHALQIMNEMIAESLQYKPDIYHYQSSFETPGRVQPPPHPPSTGDDSIPDTYHHHLNYENTEIVRPPTHRPPADDEMIIDEDLKLLNKNAGIKVQMGLTTPILVAVSMGVVEMIEKILEKFPVAILDVDSRGKNALMLAAENRQTGVFDYLVAKRLPEYLFHQVDDEGNSILHLAASLGDHLPWRLPFAALQMHWEIKWYNYVKSSIPPVSSTRNMKGETPKEVFTRTHKNLVNDGADWLVKTSNSCSVIAALIATVAFASTATVPGGLRENDGRPVLEKHTAFDVFSVSSLVALTLSMMALIFFLSISISRCEERDFELRFPRQLFIALTSLFGSIVTVLVSFCAGHTFILRDKFKYAAVPIYGVAFIPVAFFVLVQLPIYDLLWAVLIKVPQLQVVPSLIRLPMDSMAAD